jgi:GxxExxY protein
MNLNDFPDLHVGKVETYPCKEETHAIIGCAFEVLNELGHGLNEKLYENALVVEFKHRGIAFDQQRRFEVLYKSEHVGEFVPDLIAYGKVVVSAFICVHLRLNFSTLWKTNEKHLMTAPA